MAHSTVHAAVGMAAGLAIGLPALRAAWQSGKPVARQAAAWIALGAACAAWALTPSILHFMGVPEAVRSGPWTLIFFLHPAIARIQRWTGFAGPVALAGLLAAQYVVLLAAIRRADRSANR
jgi:hypothetical protein